MRLLDIFALFGLSVMVNGAWWAAAMQPVLLSVGAVFAAFDLDLEPFLNAKPIDFRNLMAPKKETSKKEKDDKEKDEKAKDEKAIDDG